MSKKVLKMRNDYLSHSIDLVEGNSFKQAVADGHYDSISYGISAKRFPLCGKKQEDLRIYLVDLDEEEKESESIIMDSESIGLYSAGSEELLALGAQYPQLQIDHPIIALGSVVRIDGHLRLLGLSESDGQRRLVLEWYLGLWPIDYRFAFISEERS